MKIRSVLASVLLLSTALACNFPTIPNPFGSQVVQPPSEETLSADLETAIDRLASEDSAQQGVWALLRQLGVGIYRGDGSQLLAGSETNPEDFWLYDFQVPLLAQMAVAEPRPFDLTYARFQGLGYEGSAEDLLASYRSTYRQHADELIPQVLQRMDVSLNDPPALTPLQEWLLLLDTFVPPNPQPAATATGHLFSPRPAGGSCGTIVGGQIIPNWGVMYRASDLAALLAAEEAYVALHGELLLSSLHGEVRASAEEAHEGHGGPGDRIEFSATLSMDYRPQDVPVAAVECGVLLNTDPPIVGPIDGAEVFWEADGALLSHGTLEVPAGGTSLTDASGEAGLSFQAQPEAADGEGELQSAVGSVSASVNLRGIVLSRAGPMNPRLMLFLPDRVPIGIPQVVTISWHQEEEEKAIPDGHWAGTISSETEISYRDLLTTGTFSGPIEFTVAAGEVEGSWRMVGSGTTTMEDAYATITGTNEGRILGTSTRPLIVTTRAHVEQEMTITIDGVNVTQSDSREIELEDEEPHQIPVESISCEEVSGEWRFQPYSYVEGSGWFHVRRVDDLSEEEVEAYQEKLDLLFTSAHELLASARESGTIDFSHLEALLLQAEDLRAAMDRSQECSDQDLDRFANPLQGLLTDLLEFGLENPEAIDAAGLRRLMAAAEEVGALKRPIDSDTDDIERASSLAEMIRERVDQAADSEDCEALDELRQAQSFLDEPGLDDYVQSTWDSVCR